MSKELTWATALKDAGEFQSHRIESTPNGQTYGSAHIPCNHVAVFEYTRATVRLANAGGHMQLSREAK